MDDAVGDVFELEVWDLERLHGLNRDRQGTVHGLPPIRVTKVRAQLAKGAQHLGAIEALSLTVCAETGRGLSGVIKISVGHGVHEAYQT